MNKLNPDIVALFKSFSSAIYDLVFIFELSSDMLLYCSDNIIMELISKKSQKASSSFFQTLLSLSGEKKDTIENLIKTISDYLKKDNTNSPENTIFISELGYKLNTSANSSATYKFIPIPIENNIRYMMCCIGLSAGIYKNKILATDKSFKNKMICDISKGVWSKYETKDLNTNEMAVLALSAEGYNVNEISEIMYKAPDTIKSIRKNIFLKFGVPNIQKAITYAFVHKINTSTCNIHRGLAAWPSAEDETD